MAHDAAAFGSAGLPANYSPPYTSGVYCTKCASLSVYRSSFDNFTKLDGTGGAALELISVQTEGIIVDSNFTNNVAAYGGALSV